MRGFGIVLSDIAYDGFELVLQLLASSESASRPKKPLDAVSHLFVVYEVAAVCGCDASIDAFDKLRLTFEHASNGFLYHLRGLFAFAGGEPFELRLGVGSEMAFRVKNRVAFCQQVGASTRPWEEERPS